MSKIVLRDITYPRKFSTDSVLRGVEVAISVIIRGALVGIVLAIGYALWQSFGLIYAVIICPFLVFLFLTYNYLLEKERKAETEPAQPPAVAEDSNLIW